MVNNERHSIGRGPPKDVLRTFVMAASSISADGIRKHETKS